MPTPVLLITGFLGAGKTTLINRLLADPQGRRLAAVVNDFGAIDIDAALLSGASDDVISLKNGCICCSLQGDLLQTLSAILRRRPAPDGIVIETSGISNPAEIIRALLDPVIWKEAALETVICAADARALVDEPRLFDDPLWRSQVSAADFIALSKVDLVTVLEREQVGARLRDCKTDHAIHVMRDGHLPRELLFADHSQTRSPRAESMTAPEVAVGNFQALSWTSKRPLVMASFQNVVAQYARALIRAKGFVTFAERASEPVLFQLVGARATVAPAPVGHAKDPAVQLVFIARAGTLDEDGLKAALARCCARPPG